MYAIICGWLNGHLADEGYQACAPTREVYLVGPETGKDPSEYVTEIQVPLQPVCA